MTLIALAPDMIGAQAAIPGPVPDDPAAVAMFTAHRIDDTLSQLAHGCERLCAAREAGDLGLRDYHVAHLRHHLAEALEGCHQLTGNVDAHYPVEAAELKTLTQTIGLAENDTIGGQLDLSVSVTSRAKTATFAHLLETVLYHCGHASRHADAMAEPGTSLAEWEFNADHAEPHTAGALEHTKKLAVHVRDNYPAEAKWLKRLDEDEDVTDMAATIGGQAGRD